MNTPIELPGGTLTMCDVKDFRDTLKPNHTVVTLCKYPPKYNESDKNECYHYYFRYHNADPEVWATAVLMVHDLIIEGRDVLLHCVHGKDRTGGVAYAVLRLFGFDHETTCSMMKEARPKMVEKWNTILEERQTFHEAAYNVACQMIDALPVCTDAPWWGTYFSQEQNSAKGIAIGSI
jgi:protein tyrosine/serine phosphatase